MLCLKAKDDMLLENEWTSAKVFGCTKMKLKLTSFWVDLDEWEDLEWCLKIYAILPAKLILIDSSGRNSTELGVKPEDEDAVRNIQTLLFWFMWDDS